jgi:uncharacterized protein YcbK (DUF882 family)
MSNQYINYNEPIVKNGSFKWKEFAILKGWNHFLIPNEKQKENAIFLFSQLEPLRKELGMPLIITSGARDEVYIQDLIRRGYKAALKSAHLNWQAVDLTCPGIPNATLWNWFNKKWPGRMENLSATPTWVHLDTLQWNQYHRFNP